MKDISAKAWIIVILINLLMVVGCMFIYKILEADTTEKVFTCLCNSCFVGGAFMFGFGLLVWCANQGAFIGIQYGVKQIFEKRQSPSKFEKRKSYAEYRSEKLKKKANFEHMLIVGASFIALSLIFLVLI